MASQTPMQTPTDGPFGLQPNVAAGLAYLLGIVGGLIMYFGGGTNRFVKWSAAQSITLWAVYIILWIVVDIAGFVLHGLALLLFPIMMIVGLIWFILWIWTFITGFQGKEVRVPVIADLTRNFFKDVSTTAV